MEDIIKQKIENFNSLQKSKTEHFAIILEQYLLQKSNILEKVKRTFLFPYLLNMEYLVGYLESVKVTEDPIEEIAPYLNIQDGINQTLKVKFNREELLDWELFRLKTMFYPDEYNSYELKSYILIKISGESLELLIFGILENKIITQDDILKILDSDQKIIETKKLLGLI